MHTRFFILLAVLVSTALMVAADAGAQYNGHNTRGDYGLTSGSLPPPGWFVGAFYYNYDIDTLRNRDGDRIAIDPERRGSLTIQAFGPLIMWVSGKEILGGNYAFSIVPSVANSSLSVPVLGLDQDTSFTMYDTYIQPAILGWHRDRADFMAGLGLFAPTGRYEDGADDNVGLGMWTYELFAGTTLYLDRDRKWNLACTAFWETHSSKEDSDAKVGDLLTLEGGLGRAFAEGAINVGVSYYAQWKLTNDDLGLDFPADIRINKHQVFGLGPELALPIVAKQKLIALVTARYVFEFDAESTSEGDTFFIGLTFPIGADWGA